MGRRLRLVSEQVSEQRLISRLWIFGSCVAIMRFGCVDLGLRAEESVSSRDSKDY